MEHPCCRPGSSLVSLRDCGKLPKPCPCSRHLAGLFPGFVLVSVAYFSLDLLVFCSSQSYRPWNFLRDLKTMEKLLLFMEVGMFFVRENINWLDCVIFHLEVRRLKPSLVEIFIYLLSGLFYLLFINILYKY